MNHETLSVHLLGKDYQVNCPEGERDALLLAATELDRRMKDIRQQSNVIGTERIAIMAALNLTNELLQNQPSTDHQAQEYLQRIHKRLDTILE